MLKLPTPEIAIFLSVLTIYLAASIIGILQLLADGGKYKRFLMPLVSLAVTLETILLIFRAVPCFTGSNAGDYSAYIQSC
jgi:hypothetical protein